MSQDDDAESEPGVEWRMARLEEIAETLGDGEVGLERAKELREEADGHLGWLKDELDVGDGEIIELDADEPGIDSTDSGE